MSCNGHKTPDVLIVGAGPVGSVTAIAFARRGARVLLLEARSDEPKRLAGEWIHPSGVDILKELDIFRPESAAFPNGRGFVVFPDDDLDPIILPYAPDRLGYSCEHRTLVTILREQACATPGVQFLPSARLTALTEQRATYVQGDRPGTTVECGTIVGADGRSSAVRKLLGLADDRVLLSCMAGVLLEDAELPCEGFGHVVLGGPGPALLYRVSPRHIRACLDVPLRDAQRSDKIAFLRQGFLPVLPAVLRPAFLAALEQQPVIWAANHVRTRGAYGRRGVFLVGDAVGSTHPLTATGMTIGFQDAATLAATTQLSAYQRGRAHQCLVPERLANSLYAAFSRQDNETKAIRRAIFKMWRNEPRERERTMQLLCAENTSTWQFRRVFFKVAAMTLKPFVDDVRRGHALRQPLVTLQRLRRQWNWLDN